MTLDLLSFRADIESCYGAAARSRVAESAQHPHGCGLSCAVGSEEAEYLPFAYIEADMVYGREGAEAFGEVSY